MSYRIFGGLHELTVCTTFLLESVLCCTGNRNHSFMLSDFIDRCAMITQCNETSLVFMHVLPLPSLKDAASCRGTS